VEEFKKLKRENLKALIPRAREAREILPDELRKMGAKVDVVESYVTIMPENRAEAILKMLEARDISMITFTSSSTVTNFMGMFGKNAEKVKEMA
jgi:uroporphyrinogen III methyltransferase/synthase